MAVIKGFKQLVAEASAQITTLSLDEAKARLDEGTALIVDLRDTRELERDGMLPGALNATRGMIEFWVDPESPYYKPVFSEQRELVLYCGGGWRSALAAQTLQEMGYDGPVSHIDGGFAAWKQAGLPVVPKPDKPQKPSAS